MILFNFEILSGDIFVPPYTPCICHMGVICIDRNTTAVDISQVAIKYTFDLAVRNVRGQIASIFFTGVHMLKPQYF